MLLLAIKSDLSQPHSAFQSRHRLVQNRHRLLPIAESKRVDSSTEISARRPSPADGESPFESPTISKSVSESVKRRPVGGGEFRHPPPLLLKNPASTPLLLPHYTLDVPWSFSLKRSVFGPFLEKSDSRKSAITSTALSTFCLQARNFLFDRG